MLARWTQILPAFLYKRLAQRCGVISVFQANWHKADPETLVLSRGDRPERVSSLIDRGLRSAVLKACQKHGAIRHRNKVYMTTEKARELGLDAHEAIWPSGLYTGYLDDPHDPKSTLIHQQVAKFATKASKIKVYR